MNFPKKLFIFLASLLLNITGHSQEVIVPEGPCDCPYPIIFVHGWAGSGESWEGIYGNEDFEKIWGTLQGKSFKDILNPKPGNPQNIDRVLDNEVPTNIYQVVLNASESTNVWGDNGFKDNLGSSTIFDDDVIVHEQFTNSPPLKNGCLYAINFDNTWNNDSDNPRLEPDPDFDNLVFPDGDGQSDSNESSAYKQGYALGKMITKVLEVTGKEKVILIGHSMGGLAIREYLQRKWWERIGQTSHGVARVLTVGTPHLGANTGNEVKKWQGSLANSLLGFDLKSEAVRDLRYSYDEGGTNTPGVYLFGGGEGTIPINENSYEHYYNKNVNCNETEEESIIGINNGSRDNSGIFRFHYSFPDDIKYTYYVSDISNPGPFMASNSDGIVLSNRQWLFNEGNGTTDEFKNNQSIPIPYKELPFILSDRITSETAYHVEDLSILIKGVLGTNDKTVETSDINNIIRGIDEPDYPYFAYEIESNKWYSGLAQQRADIVPENSSFLNLGKNYVDSDWFKVKIDFDLYNKYAVIVKPVQNNGNNFFQLDIFTNPNPFDNPSKGDFPTEDRKFTNLHESQRVDVTGTGEVEYYVRISHLSGANIEESWKEPYKFIILPVNNTESISANIEAENYASAWQTHEIVPINFTVLNDNQSIARNYTLGEMVNEVEVNIKLYKGTELLETIENNIPAIYGDNTYNWTPYLGTTDLGNLRFKVELSHNPDIYDFTNPFFIYSPPENEDCSTAKNIPEINIICEHYLVNKTSFYLDNAINSNTTLTPSCMTGIDGDAWFKVTVPPSGNFSIYTSSVGLNSDIGLAVYSGSCNNLTEIGCKDDGSNIFPEMPIIDLANQVPNSILYIRVFDYDDSNYGPMYIWACEDIFELGNCNDGIKNNGERDIDCGGTCPTTCGGITYPNGNESLTAGQSINITWTPNYNYTRVKLGLSPDGGANWMFPTDVNLAGDGYSVHVANNGSFEWAIPCINYTTGLPINSNNCIIGLFDDNSAFPSGLIDKSDASFTINACGNGAPDFILQNPQITSTQIYPGSGRTLSIQVGNIGNLPAPTNKDPEMAFFLSEDDVWDEGEDLEICSDVNILVTQVGEFDNEVCSFTIPQNTAHGTYYLIAVADHLNEVEELDETNNELIIPLIIGDVQIPDFTINSASISPTDYLPNNNIVIDFNLQNIGTAYGQTMELNYYLSQDDQLDANDQLVYFSSRGSLDPQEITIDTDNFSIASPINPGNWFLILDADGRKRVEEGNESNNSYAIPFSISGLPDLTISGLISTPSIISPETEIILHSELSNLGQSSATNFSNNFYFSEDQILDANDVLISTINQSTLQEQTISIVKDTLVIQDIPNNTKYIIGKVDADKTILEYDETNNITTFPITTSPFKVALTTASASCGGNDGTASIEIIGDTSPFNIEWSNGENNSPGTNNLSPGSYTVSVTDNSGAEIVKPFFIGDNAVNNYDWDYEGGVFNNSGNYYFCDKAKDKDGNIYLVYKYRGDLIYNGVTYRATLTSHDLSIGSFFLAKFDENGNLITVKPYILSSGIGIYRDNVRIDVDSEGYIYYKVHMDYYNWPLREPPSIDSTSISLGSLILKCDSNGSIIEKKDTPNSLSLNHYTPFNNDRLVYLNSINGFPNLVLSDTSFQELNNHTFSKQVKFQKIISNNSKIYTIGSFYNSTNFLGVNLPSSGGIFFAQFDKDLNLNWIKYSNSGEQEFSTYYGKIRFDELDNMYISFPNYNVPITIDGINISTPLSNKTNYVLLKIAENGDIDKYKTFINEPRFIWDFDVSKTGNIILAGSNQFQFNSNTFPFGSFVVELNSDLEFNWEKHVSRNTNYRTINYLSNSEILETNRAIETYDNGNYDHLPPGSFYYSKLKRAPIENFSINLGNDTILCAGETLALTVDATANVSYLWSTGDTIRTITINNSDTYRVTVTDESGCGATEEIEVTFATPIDLISTTANAHCGNSDGKIMVNPIGGIQPYTFTWNNNSNSQNLQNLNAGNYQLTINDNAGCELVKSFTIENESGITSVNTTNTATTCGLNNGKSEVSVTGGTEPYTIIWNDGEIGNNQNNLSAGNHSLTVTDINGCTLTKSFNIDSTPSLVGTTSITPISNCIFNNASATIDISGGTSPYQILWNTGDSTNTIENLSAGIYSVLVIDASGCELNQSVTIEDYQVPEITFSTINSTCTTGGSIATDTNNGQTPYNYIWNNGETTKDLNNLQTGLYILTITDANNCETVAFTEIKGPSRIELSSTSIPTNCDNLGSATVVIESGGTSPYGYIWNNGQTTETATNLNAGIYVVTVTDNQGCSAIQSIVVGGNANFTLEISTADDLDISADGKIFSSIYGGVSPFQYSWSNGAVSQNLTNLNNGDYSLTVTDANGCIQISSANIQDIYNCEFAGDYNMGGNPITSKIYRVESNLYSSGYVHKDSSVTFKAGSSILLKPGFHAQQGSDFLATIEACTAENFQTETPNSKTLALNNPIDIPKSPIVSTSKIELSAIPNPFSATTTIEYTLPKASNIHLALFSITGQKVQTLVNNAPYTTGKHQLILNRNQLEEGMYFLVLLSEEERVTRKVILVE